MTVYELGSSITNNLPPQATIVLMDSEGNKFTPTGVTFHPAEGDEPYWGSVDFEAEPVS